MDFFVTIPSGPTPDMPDSQTTWHELNFEKPIELEGKYEVALVQSVFKDVFTGSLATVNIFPSTSGMEMSSFDLSANDGESVEKIIERLNRKIFDEYYSKNIQVPVAQLNESKAEFTMDLPKGWQCFITDVDQNYLVAEHPYYKFKNKNYHHLRHFYVFSNLVDDQILANNQKSQVLTNFSLGEIKSNVTQYNHNLPRYVKIKDNCIKNFTIEYSSSINAPTNLKGQIISTLHFRKANGF